MNRESQSRRVLVVHGDRKTQRTVHRILGSAADAVEIADTITDAERLTDARQPDLVVLDHHLFLAPGGAAFSASLRRHQTPCLVLLSAPDLQDVAALFEAGEVSHLLANPMPILAEELTATAHKLWLGDHFGVEKYLSWGTTVRSLALENSVDRSEVVASLAGDARANGLSGRVASLASLVADELLANALYNAPVDHAGRRLQSSGDRLVARALAGRDAITLRYACDARYLAIEVTDAYGSIAAKTIAEHVAKGARHDGGKVSFHGVGAGMGIALAYSCASQLVFNLERGRRTQVIGLIDVRFRPAELDGQMSSLHIFEADDAGDIA